MKRPKRLAPSVADERPPELILQGLLCDRDDAIVELALAARAAVLREAGAVVETVYQTYCLSDSFSFTGKLGQAFIHIATYANHVNLGFDQGAALEDPDGLLQGKGTRIRHIRLKDVASVRNHSVRRLIREAVRLGQQMADGAGGLAPAGFRVQERKK